MNIGGSKETFTYTIGNFIQNATIAYNDTTLILGTFYSCVETKGFRPSPKKNCTFE